MRKLLTPQKQSLLWSLLCGLMILCSSNVNAEAQKNQLTAALIYKIYPYLTFSVEPEVPTFCFIGLQSADVAKSLENNVKNGTVNRPIEILTLTDFESIDVEMCNIIYAAPSIRLHRKEIKRLSEYALTIGDNSNFEKNGSIFSITFENNKPSLAFSRANLKDSKIKINSNLLRHLKKVN